MSVQVGEQSLLIFDPRWAVLDQEFQEAQQVGGVALESGSAHLPILKFDLVGLGKALQQLGGAGVEPLQYRGALGPLERAQKPGEVLEVTDAAHVQKVIQSVIGNLVQVLGESQLELLQGLQLERGAHARVLVQHLDNNVLDVDELQDQTLDLRVLGGQVVVAVGQDREELKDPRGGVDQIGEVLQALLLGAHPEVALELTDLVVDLVQVLVELVPRGLRHQHLELVHDLGAFLEVLERRQLLGADEVQHLVEVVPQDVPQLLLVRHRLLPLILVKDGLLEHLQDRVARLQQAVAVQLIPQGLTLPNVPEDPARDPLEDLNRDLLPALNGAVEPEKGGQEFG